MQQDGPAVTAGDPLDIAQHVQQQQVVSYARFIQQLVGVGVVIAQHIGWEQRRQNHQPLPVCQCGEAVQQVELISLTVVDRYQQAGW